MCAVFSGFFLFSSDFFVDLGGSRLLYWGGGGVEGGGHQLYSGWL